MRYGAAKTGSTCRDGEAVLVADRSQLQEEGAGPDIRRSQHDSTSTLFAPRALYFLTLGGLDKGLGRQLSVPSVVSQNNNQTARDLHDQQNL